MDVENSGDKPQARRELKTRKKKWAIILSSWLASHGVKPNFISCLSVVSALASAICFLSISNKTVVFQIILLVLAGAFIQLRLLFNMLDGLVAVEGGLHSKTGDLFNEIPDRIADVLILSCAGYAVVGGNGVLVGWLAATLAIFTAYLRLLGGSLGFRQNFCGPMATPHRMFVLTVGAIVSAVVVNFIPYDGRFIYVALLVIVIGSVITSLRRIKVMAQELENK